MSSGCGNCDCADKSQCTKKGNSFGVEIVETNNNKMRHLFGTELEYEMEIVGGENGCKCAPTCKCNGKIPGQ